MISVLSNDRCHLTLSIQCYPTIKLNFIQNFKTTKKYSQYMLHQLQNLKTTKKVFMIYVDIYMVYVALMEKGICTPL